MPPTESGYPAAKVPTKAQAGLYDVRKMKHVDEMAMTVSNLRIINNADYLPDRTVKKSRP